MPTRMLIVEDNPTNLELMSYLLGAFGYSYSVARDGAEGVEVARRERPDLIICDIQLPKMDGYQVVQTLKRDPAFQNIPMLAVTALAMVGDRDKVLSKGFSGYIAKPIQPETFVGQVEKYLDAYQRSHQEPRDAATVETEFTPARAHERGLILVVDDQEANRSLARALLESYGYLVTAEASVADGIAAVSRQTPDLILSDFHLGDGTGLDLFERLRSRPALRSTPFVLISSTFLTLEQRAAVESAGVKLILRPIDSERLLAEIEARMPASNSSESTGNGDNSGR